MGMQVGEPKLPELGELIAVRRLCITAHIVHTLTLYEDKAESNDEDRLELFGYELDRLEALAGGPWSGVGSSFGSTG